MSKNQHSDNDDHDNGISCNTKRFKSGTNITPFHNKGDFIVIWCDESQAPDELKVKLQSTCEDVYYYQDANDCLDYIKTLHIKEHVFLIVSATFLGMDEAKKLRQVDTIFIWGTASSEPASGKIEIIPSNTQELVDAISRVSLENSRQQELFNLYNQHQKSFFNLSESTVSFLWFKLFKDMLIHGSQHDIEFDEATSAKQLMIEKCSAYYRHNTDQLKNIASFRNTYVPSDAMSWYTSNTFVYKLINKALRTGDITVLFTFRFFIIDLCTSLAEKCKRMREREASTPLVVYRGSQMTKTDIDVLQSQKDCLVATNGFLSTTRNHEVAQMFAGTGSKISRSRGEIHAVIFKIVISPDLKTVVFADVAEWSNITSEEEVLFDIGTSFRISNVTYDDSEQTWVILLTGSDSDQDILGKEYFDFYREHTKNLSRTIKLGEFLTIVGRYDQAKSYFHDLMKINSEEEVYILYDLAWIDQCQGKYIDAQEKLNRAYELEQNTDPPCQQMLRNIIVGHGNIHSWMGETDLALNCFQRANQINETSSVLNNIGICYRQKQQWSKSLKFLNKALEMNRVKWPNGHHDIGITLDNIGRTYNCQGKFREALTFHKNGLHMKQLTLPENHKDIGISYNNIGLTYDNLKMYSKALFYYKRADSIYEICLPEIHREKGILFDNMGIAYRFKGEWTQCLHYHQLALHVKERLDPIDRLTLAQTLHNLGVAYVDKPDNSNSNEFRKAFEYFEKALDMHKLNGSLKSSAAALTFYEQGRFHERHQEYHETFESLIQALNIQQRVLPRNHPETINTRTVLIGLKIEL